MPIRVLLHGHAASSEGAQLDPGSFARDVTVRGQMLMHIEFLTRYAGEGAYCVCTQNPPYLTGLAELFPCIHFLAFGALQLEYDPAQPALSSPVTAHTLANVTRYSTPYTCDVARGLASLQYAGTLVMICHGEDPARQLCLHVHTRPAFSLLELPAVPQDYIEGELVLPIYVDRGKALLLLVAQGDVKGRRYDPALLAQELGKAPRPSHTASHLTLPCSPRSPPIQPPIQPPI